VEAFQPFELPNHFQRGLRAGFDSADGGRGAQVVMLLWGCGGLLSVLTVLVPYFVMLGLQILSEILTLRWFHSIVVVLPYLYLTIWQLYQGLTS